MAGESAEAGSFIDRASFSLVVHRILLHVLVNQVDSASPGCTRKELQNCRSRNACGVPLMQIAS
jgi:hypothetical protein